MIKKVLLLNPPGKKRYIRDYYCSKVSKAWYIYPPVDLLILSAVLYGHFEIKVTDAIADNLSVDKCLKEIDSFCPDAVIFLTGAVSRSEDFEFIRRVKNKKNILTVASGDFLMEKGDVFLKSEYSLDAIILDFTSNDIVAYLNGDLRQPVQSMIYRLNGDLFYPAVHKQEGEFRIAIPRHELFLNKRYSYPFVRRNPFATVLTDYGCLFKCPFCIMASLGYKYRPVDNILEEIAYLHSLGINEIYFADQTFGAVRKRTLQLCQEFASEFPKLGWVCFSRVDITDEEMLKAMKEGGCHTIIYGIESGSEEILNKYKGIRKERVKETIDLCRKHKIRVVGTFIIGLPGETEDTVKETIKFSKECNLEYVSINMAVPRSNTRLRQEAIEKNLCLSHQDEMDQSGTYSVMGTGYLSKDDVLMWHRYAVKQFYLRPKYLLKRLFAIKSCREFRTNILEGYSLLKAVFKS